MAVNPVGINQGTNTFVRFEDDGGTINTQVIDVRQGTITSLTRVNTIGTLEVGTITISAINSVGTLGTLQVGTISSMPNITQGSIQVTAGTVSAGTINIGTVVGGVAGSAADSGNPVKVGAVYYGTAPTYTSGNRTDLLADINGNLLINPAAKGAGEDLSNDVMKVEQQFSYYHHVGTAGSTSGTVKSGAGFLHSVIFNTHTTAGTYALYDSVGTSGTVIAILAGTNHPVPPPYDVSFANGLTVVSGSVCDLTVAYR